MWIALLFISGGAANGTTDVFPVNWDSVLEVLNKEQFFCTCHISKSTALHLLKSGKVPFEWSGKKTRCYKIRKEDVKAYLDERAIFPELYSAPKGWYGTHYVARLSKELPEDTLRQMHGYYEKLLRKYPDVVTVKDVVALTGYTLTTVHNWCSRGSLKSFQKGLKFCIPKIFLVDFFCSLTDGEMAQITAMNKDVRYYTSTPEMLKKYAEMVPPVDEQK